MPIDSESAVRRYLQFIQDPNSLVDAKEVARLEQSVASATDPIDKLRALTQLARAKQPNTADLEREFVAGARAWAEANDIDLAAFRQLGVSDRVLRAAQIGQQRGARTSNRRRPAGVAVETIEANIRGREGQFTVRDVATAVGGSPMTLRKAFESMQQRGVIRKLGPSQEYQGRGRAPMVYEAG